MMKRQVHRCWIVLAVLTLLVSACGDGSSSSPGEQGGVVGTSNGTGDGQTSNSNGEVNSNGVNSNGTVNAQVMYLSPTDHLVRASMALRGLRPSVEELEMVRDDPASFEGIIDTYLTSDAFGTTIRDMHNEQLMLRPFFFWFPPRGEMVEKSLIDFNASVAESPLKLIEHVVMNDRPYSEIITADYTLADETVAAVWGMEYDGDGDTWIETRWPDEGRVHAGILTDSGLYIRHYSTPLNAQRSRANMVSRTFLCFDFLDNDINVSGNIDLSDPEAVRNAVKSPECASCHQTLDPMAALFWRHEFFVSPGTITEYPFVHYRPEYESQYRAAFSDREPGFFGKPVNNLRELGGAISEDPRFAMCSVKRFYSYLAQVPLGKVPTKVAIDLQPSFVDNNMSAKALAKAIVMSDGFRASHIDDPEQAEDLYGVQKVRPRQWTRMMQDLIGFRWGFEFPYPLEFITPDSPYGFIDLMTDNLLGYEVLAGGIDDFVVTNPVHTINPTNSLVLDNFAVDAASFVVERDLDGGEPASDRLLRIGADDTAEASVRQELARLHLTLFAEFAEPDSEEVNASYALFNAALALSSDSRRAWKTTLTAMLQDSRLVYY